MDSDVWSVPSVSVTTTSKRAASGFAAAKSSTVPWNTTSRRSRPHARRQSAHIVPFVSTAATLAAPALSANRVSKPVPHPRSSTRGARPSRAANAATHAPIARS